MTDLSSIGERLTKAEEDIEEIKTDVTETDSEVAGVKSDVTDLTGEVTDLKSQIDEVLDIETIPSKNLNQTIYPNTYTEKGVTFTHNEDGSISMSGTQTAAIYWNPTDKSDMWLLPAGTYTVSGGRPNIGITVLGYVNKEDSSATINKSSVASSTTFTTAQDLWVRIRIDIASAASPDGITLYPQLEVGSQATEYQDPNYTETHSERLDELDELTDNSVSYILQTGRTETEKTQARENIDAASGADVDELKGNFDVLLSANIIDPTFLVAGAINEDGTLATNGAWGNYKTSDFVELEADTYYTLSCWNNGTIKTSTKRLVMYDSGKTVQPSTFQSENGQSGITFNSGSYKYVRVTAYGDYDIMLEKSSSVSPYFIAYSKETVLGVRFGEPAEAQVSERIAELGITDGTFIPGKTS